MSGLGHLARRFFGSLRPGGPPADDETWARSHLRPGEVELCRTDEPNITSPADWNGKNLGITDLGSSTDFLTKYLAVRNGVPVNAIHELGVQAGTTFIFSTHDAKVMKHANAVVQIADGKIVGRVRPEEASLAAGGH